MAKRNIDKAKEAKKDEFYTQLDDINNELKHYREHFRGKTVLCVTILFSALTRMFPKPTFAP